MRDDRLEHIAHLEAVRVALVVEDVASGDGRLSQVPDERPVAQRQIAESVRIELDDRRFVDALEQVFSLWRRGRRHRPCLVSSIPVS